MRKIIREELENAMGGGDSGGGSSDITKISIDKLKRACLAAAQAAMGGESNIGGEVDHNDIFWVITNKPRMVSGGSDEGEYDREEWTETNEPELASALVDNWESVACDVNGRKVVFLCGSEDDEYGYYWDNSDQEWVSYNF